MAHRTARFRPQPKCQISVPPQLFSIKKRKRNLSAMRKLLFALTPMEFPIIGLGNDITIFSPRNIGT
jgi:hypothetical protein